jgi:hypothetical protein
MDEPDDDCPTTTQSPAAEQLIDAADVKPGGGEAVVQVSPPSLLETSSTPPEELKLEPMARH